MTTITGDMIVTGLRQLGLQAGSHILVHSALSSFGYVEGGADTVIDALLTAVGADGTVMAPTLTGSESLSAANPPVFNPLVTPCWTGRIPQTLRQRPQAVRSLHPTHSTAAIGAAALALTSGHRDSITPCDSLSPYGRLAQMPDGYILLLGVDHESSTTFHHVEELVGVAYHMQPGLAQARIEAGEQSCTRHIMLHAYGTPRRFMTMEPVFIERGIQRSGQIGAAVVRLIHAPRMVEITAQALRADPRILCAP
jgi:aminoglycoside 3-N-acetyltransferase